MSLGGNLGQIAANDRKNQGGHDRSDQVPQRAHDSLLKSRHEIAPYEHHDQVAVAPQLAKVDIEPAGDRADGLGPPVRTC